MTDVVPLGHVLVHVFPNKFNVTHDVQLVRVREHVSQSPWQASATPDIFKYPAGTVSRQLLFSKTYPASHDKQTEGEEQFSHPLLRSAQGWQSLNESE